MHQSEIFFEIMHNHATVFSKLPLLLQMISGINQIESTAG